MTPEQRTIVERFHGFDDALIESIEISFEKSGFRRLVILLACRDWQDIGGAWSRVKVSVSQLIEYRFFEAARTSMQVLVNGLHFFEEAGIVGIELGDLVDAPTSMEELHESQLYAVGLTFELEILA